MPRDAGRTVGLRRRTLLGGLAAAAASGSLLAACSRLGGPAPSPSHGKTILVLQPNGTIPFNRTTVALYNNALQPFLAAHPGVDVQLTQSLWGANVSAILAGQAADVISDNYPPPYMAASGNLLLPLGTYISRENVDTSTWSSGQIASYAQAAPDGGTYMLPAYFSPLVYVVRLSDFSDANLPVPDPDWDHLSFARTAQQMTRTGSKPRYGAVLEWSSIAIGEATYMFQAFGNGMLDASGHSILASANNVAAGRYLYEQLLWPGYATTRDKLGPWYNTLEFISDQVTMQLCWDGLVLDAAQRYTGFDWDFYPPPVYPQGPTCMGTDDFYAIPAGTAHPDLAWELLKFLTCDASATGWQRAMMKVGLLQPSLLALWDDWMATVRAVAPLLGTKRLEYFKEMAVSGRAFPEQYYRYLDRQCQGLASPHVIDLWQRQTDVPTAFAAIDLQVNALLAQAGSLVARTKALAEAAAAVNPGPSSSYGPPDEAGAGLGASPAAGLIRHDAKAGAWTMLGDGAAVTNWADACTFAAAPAVDSEGDYTCRITALANLTCPALSPWAGAGLMARADLSDDAPMVALMITGGHQLQWQSRAIAAVAATAQSDLSLPAQGGKPPVLTAAQVPPATNALTQSIWLRLHRAGETWTALASLDGVTYKQIGDPAPARMGGVWVGICACAHNADFTAPGGRANYGYIRAQADTLDFAPTRLVQLGVEGIPPQAGQVPGDWATIQASTPPAVG